MANTAAMPKNIVLFERLAFASLAFSVLSDLLDKELQELGAVMLALLVVISVVLIGGLIWLAVRRRQTWARWVYSVLGVLLVIGAIYLDFVTEAPDIWERLAGVLSALLMAASLYFLWSGDSAAWF